MIETFPIEMKLAVSKKNEFEHRGMLEPLEIFAVFVLAVHRRKEQNRILSIKKSSIKSKRSNKLLMQNLKLLVLQKYEFENRDL